MPNKKIMESSPSKVNSFEGVGFVPLNKLAGLIQCIYESEHIHLDVNGTPYLDMEEFV